MSIVPVLLAVSVALQGGPDIVLPSPNGPHSVGVVTYAWTDSARVDSLSSPPGPRSVLGRIWYPAAPNDGATLARYAEHLDAAANEWTQLHARVRTHSWANVPFSTRVARGPVIVFATGRSTATFDYTTLAEDLASHGYVVVGVDSPHHSKVVLPDGTLLPVQFPSMGPSTYPNGFDSAQAPMNRLVSADVRFVVRRLIRLDREHPILGGHLDLTRVGLAGHSNGGMAGSRACADEPSCRAFFSIEGMQTRELRLNGVDKPYGLLYSEATLAFDTLQVFTEMRRHAKGPFVLYRVNGAGHNSVTDLLFVRPTLFSYPIDPRRGAAVTHAITRAFFDQYLLGRPGAGDVAAGMPEVKVERFGANR
jgi:dienelactone hydrolase